MFLNWLWRLHYLCNVFKNHFYFNSTFLNNLNNPLILFPEIIPQGMSTSTVDSIDILFYKIREVGYPVERNNFIKIYTNVRVCCRTCRQRATRRYRIESCLVLFEQSANDTNLVVSSNRWANPWRWRQVHAHETVDVCSK